VPKFELYQHNDELFNKYYGIFYELWTFVLICIIGQNQQKFKVHKKSRNIC
jgi:hypothetical protein